MAFWFHGIERVGGASALARLVARVGFVDDVNLAAAAHDLAIRVALLGGFDGGNNFHGVVQSIGAPLRCQGNVRLGSVLISMFQMMNQKAGH